MLWLWLEAIWRMMGQEAWEREAAGLQPCSPVGDLLQGIRTELQCDQSQRRLLIVDDADRKDQSILEASLGQHPAFPEPGLGDPPRGRLGRPRVGEPQGRRLGDAAAWRRFWLGRAADAAALVGGGGHRPARRPGRELSHSVGAPRRPG